MWSLQRSLDISYLRVFWGVSDISLAASDSLSVEGLSLLSSLILSWSCTSEAGAQVVPFSGFSVLRGCAGLMVGCTPPQTPGKPWMRGLKPAVVLCERGRKGAAPGFSFGGSRRVTGSCGCLGHCPLLVCHSSGSVCSLMLSASGRTSRKQASSMQGRENIVYQSFHKGALWL